MPFNAEYIAMLIYRQLAGEIDTGEQAELESWRRAAPGNEDFLSDLKEDKALPAAAYKPENLARVRQEIYAAVQRSAGLQQPLDIPVRRMKAWRRWGWVAASVLLLSALGLYRWGAKENQPLVFADIQPGRQGAVLTLADGSEVLLDTVQNGVVAMQGGMAAIVRNGLLSYEDEGGGNTPVYNTMTTPKGRQFRIVLPDGTNVWLNAASSIRYPTTFSGKERKVWITGEVYFEVIAQAGRPFSVSVGGREDIAVLGTSFNVNAYENEAQLQTTLAEGSIRASLKPSGESFILKPGEQLQVSPVAAKLVKNADLAQVLAWKNGFFNFEGMKLREVMRQLERWYDIEVIYQENVQDIQFGGGLNRNISLKGVLKALERSGIHFRMEGERKLIVMPD